mmetsp:Transcript_15981/g.42318  ORF Transcript_15981/g.42318 Transcript_15981/m.42318 type:complete len:432 (+) Transcript_15981:1685-2980(+)
MPRRHEQLRRVHVGRHHFREAAEAVLAAHEVDEGVVDPGAHGEPEGAARRRDRVMKEEVLRLSDGPVVPLGCLLLEFLPVLEVFVAGEGYPVDALQGVQVLVPEPEGGGVLGDGEGLGAPRARQVGPPAEVHEGPAPIARRQAAVGDLVGDQLHLEGVLAEQLEGLLLGEHAALVRLVLLGYLHHDLLKALEVLLAQLLAAEEAVVVEARLQGRADGQVAPVLPLHRLSQDVGARVPEHVLALRVVELQQLHAAAALQGPADVPEHALLVLVLLLIRLGVGGHHLLEGLHLLLVDQLGHDDRVGQALADALRDVHRRGLESLAVLDRSVWQLYADGLLRLGGDFLPVLLDEPIPHVDAVLDVRGVLLDRELALELARFADLRTSPRRHATARCRHGRPPARRPERRAEVPRRRRAARRAASAPPGGGPKRT